MLACGLAQHSRAPAQAGSAPGDSFATVTLAQPGAGPGAAEGLSYRSLGRVAQSGVGGNWVSSLPLVREIFIAGHSVGRQPLGWTTGPLFSAIHVPLVGRAFTDHDFSAQLDGSTEREMVLTRDAAKAWFGSADAAVGKTVELEPVGFGPRHRTMSRSWWSASRSRNSPGPAPTARSLVGCHSARGRMWSCRVRRVP